MSIAPNVSWSLATSTSLLASMIIPAQEPKTGIPAAILARSGSVRSKISASFQIVVDSPPGMIRPSTAASSAGRRTGTGWAPTAVSARMCSATSPCKASTPTTGPRLAGAGAVRAAAAVGAADNLPSPSLRQASSEGIRAPVVCRDGTAGSDEPS